ncbi:DUF2092 domain-containing protein [Pseudovibrio sp. SPO723]|uniref:DUF2092 domain-containing protein n=1 Tax=Nesiotobacter zosterae TaxID=392721 RepID=UPI0029C4F661|nr:DUF2092 domain-containing protein [Pseudovibrio sp. SPO723]MDX5595083.1 DUF2092 domain-containing protein [Pseudovibrio sp. SPO723]
MLYLLPISHLRASLLFFLLCFVVVLVVPAAGQQNRAIERLHVMMERFAESENIGFTAVVSEERVFRDGVSLNFVYQYQAKISGTDKLKIIMPRVDGVSELYFYDGIISYYDKTRNLFTEGDFNATNMDLLMVLREDFGLKLPGLDIVDRNLSERLPTLTKRALFIGRTSFPEGDADHLAFVSETLHWQVWISSDTGLPRYLILTHTKEPGEPQTHVRFMHWDLETSHDLAVFDFNPPANAAPFQMGERSVERR